MSRYPGWTNDAQFLGTKAAGNAAAGICQQPGCLVWIQGGAAGRRAHEATVHFDGQEPAPTEEPPTS